MNKPVTNLPNTKKPDSTNSDNTDPLVCFNGMYTCSTLMLEIFEWLKKAAGANVPVYIWGETGTGKELTARALHEESARKGTPFLSFSCANFSETLMDSQLFGHRKGSFTGAVADQTGLLGAVENGTLFMDEVLTMDVSLQAKLLRVLQEREYSEIGSVKPIPFRGQILSASQIPLEQAVKEGSFRADLRYRLEVINIRLPPLRERTGDILPLFRKFLIEAKPASKPMSISAEACTALNSFDWPGNIRQLQNSALYAVAMSDGAKVELSDLPADVARHASETDENTKGSGDQDLSQGRRTLDFNRSARDQRPARRKSDSKKGLSAMSKDELVQVLSLNAESRVQTAANFGISRMTLWRAMKKHGLT